MAARTVLVELLSPSRAKQEAFVQLQAEVLRLGEGWKRATSEIAQAVGGSLESRSIAPLADQASVYALRSLTSAVHSCDSLPEPWRSTLRSFLRQQMSEVRVLRRRARLGAPTSGPALPSLPGAPAPGPTLPSLLGAPAPGMALPGRPGALAPVPAPPGRPGAPASHRPQGAQPDVVFGAEAWSIQIADGKWKLIIPLMGRTVAIPIGVPAAQSEALRRLMADGIPMEGRLFRKRGRWFFAARYLNEAAPRPDAPSIGVDLGNALRAVAIEPASGKRLLLSGRRDRALEDRYGRIIRELHNAGAHRSARKLEAKLERYRLQRDREVAGAVVTFAKNFDRPIVKFEADLEDRRFGRIIRMTARRAEPAGIAVAAVDGRQSSLRCSRCGSTKQATRTGARFACGCGYAAHADLNAARNLSMTATWSQTLQLAAAEQSLGGKAVGTAELASVRRNKGDAPACESDCSQPHAVSTREQILAAKFPKEGYTMASIVKDLNENSTKFVVGTLDNVKSYVDKTSEELSKVDLVNVTRHILDTALDGAKNVVKTASEPASNDTFGRLKAMADGTLEATREVVNVIAEEGKKADVFGMSTRIALEGINTLRSEVDLGLDTTKNLFNRLAPLATTAKPVVTRPPQVTRVEIEHEKPAKSSSKSTPAS